MKFIDRLLKRQNPPIVQIELAGKCTANCEFCDWTTRPKSEQVFMETVLAKKAVREAGILKSPHVSFHVTGESLDHPDFLNILPHDMNIGLSTNCLSLEGHIADYLAEMPNINIILAILWAESGRKRMQSILNAREFLERNPVCKTISVQMVCSEHATPYAGDMKEVFSPFLGMLPQMQLFYKQPYTQEPNYYSKNVVPILGYIPEGIHESARIHVDHMATPVSCGNDCLAFSPNPMSSILVQADGTIKPCFYRWPFWGLGNIRDTTLMDAWHSERLKEIRRIWYTGDPDNKQACHDCIRMVVPRGEPPWWVHGNTPPTTLDESQALKGDPSNAYPKPME